MVDADATPEQWATFAGKLVKFQFEHNAAFARLSRARGYSPISRPLSDAPAVPTDAFKLTRVSCIPESDVTTVFRTSGTTIGDRGSHHFASTATYECGALAFGATGLLKSPGGAALVPPGLRVLVLGPSPQEAPDSSLTHMNALFEATWSSTHDEAFFLRGDTLDLLGLRAAIARAHRDAQPVLLLGTSFAYVHLADALQASSASEQTLTLPKGSRLMQTGGYKGKSREVPADELRLRLASTFGVAEACIFSEYGMTELSSQFYGQLHDGVAVYTEPAWAQVTPVDPISLVPVPTGEIGIARITDCLNIDSVWAIQTQDRVRRVPGGFELLGRLPGAAPRGCSIAIDEILSR